MASAKTFLPRPSVTGPSELSTTTTWIAELALPPKFYHGELPNRNGLRAVSLPAGAGQVALDPGGKGAEADDQQQPDAETSADGDE